MPQASLTVWDEDVCAACTGRRCLCSSARASRSSTQRARELCAAAGASVEGRRVRLPTALVERRWRAPRARGRCAAAAAARRRSCCGTAASTSGADPTASTSPIPRRGRRRRARLVDVETAARVAEALPNVDFVMSMALPEDVPTRPSTSPNSPPCSRHAQTHRRLQSLRRRDLAGDAGDGCGLRRGGELRLPCHELAAAHARRRVLLQSARLRRPRHPSGAGDVGLGWRPGTGLTERLRRGR